MKKQPFNRAVETTGGEPSRTIPKRGSRFLHHGSIVIDNEPCSQLRHVSRVEESGMGFGLFDQLNLSPASTSKPSQIDEHVFSSFGPLKADRIYHMIIYRSCQRCGFQMLSSIFKPYPEMEHLPGKLYFPGVVPVHTVLSEQVVPVKDHHQSESRISHKSRLGCGGQI